MTEVRGGVRQRSGRTECCQLSVIESSEGGAWGV
jgi:hypothetical protein